MSRIGNKVINLPEGVDLTVSSNNIKVAGKKGSLVLPIPEFLELIIEEKKITIKLLKEELLEGFRYSKKYMASMWGTIRSLLNNMVIGVSEGFTVKLEVSGVGYRGSVVGKELTMNLGYSHPIKYLFSDNIDISVIKGIKKGTSIIVISGFDKQEVGKVAATIMRFRKLDPYKLKGVYLLGANLIKKEAKKK